MKTAPWWSANPLSFANLPPNRQACRPEHERKETPKMSKDGIHIKDKDHAGGQTGREPVPAAKVPKEPKDVDWRRGRHDTPGRTSCDH
jgi:hypothetical protein